MAEVDTMTSQTSTLAAVKAHGGNRPAARVKGASFDNISKVLVAVFAGERRVE